MASKADSRPETGCATQPRTTFGSNSTDVLVSWAMACSATATGCDGCSIAYCADGAASAAAPRPQCASSETRMTGIKAA